MNDKPTPRTDDQSVRYYDDATGTRIKYVAAKFACQLERELAQRERERDEWKAKHIKQNKDLGCEMMDPNGTIWDYAKKLERERNELAERLDFQKKLNRECIDQITSRTKERDEARGEVADWENAAEHVKSDHQNELHCGCVPVLRKLLTDAKNERDQLLEVLARTLNATVLNHRNDRWHLDAEYAIKKIKPAL